jgi:hypothetical protein
MLPSFIDATSHMLSEQLRQAMQCACYKYKGHPAPRTLLTGSSLLRDLA